jgi:threonine/homoserine/homoserine lactone efflux protein
MLQAVDRVSIEFLVTSLIVIVSPGTGVLYTLAAGLSRGARASVVAAFGCTLGIVPHMAAAIGGAAALLHTSALAFQTFKWLGVAYLLYMAWQALRERGALQIDMASGARREGKAQLPLAPARAAIQGENEGRRFRGRRDNIRSEFKVTIEGILINILNPKLSIFFFAFLPQFVAADEAHPLAHMAGLSAVFMALTFAVFVVYGLFAAAIREHVISRPRVLAWMRWTFAAAFVALGVKLALSQR